MGLFVFLFLSIGLVPVAHSTFKVRSLNFNLFNQPKIHARWRRERPWSKTPTWRKKCSKTPWTAPLRPLKNIISKKTLQLISKKSSTRNTTRRGIASWAEILVPTSPTKPDTLSISIWVKWPSSSSRADKKLSKIPGARLLNISFIYENSRCFKLKAARKYEEEWN